MEENWTNIDGLKIRYLELGKEHDNHVLFIHGLGSSADIWLNIPDMLSSDFHIVSLDLPGFGVSDKPLMEYTPEKFAEILIDFINKIGINDGKTSIVGHSLGGYIAVKIAIKNKHLIEKLVLIDSSGMLEAPTPLLEKYFEAAMNPSENLVKKVFKEMAVDPTKISSKVVKIFISRINLPNSKHAFKSTFENSTSTKIELSKLKLIDDIPTLILWGEKDSAIPLDHSQKFKDVLKNSQISIISNTGHSPFVEKPDLVYKMLRQFLK